MERATNIVIELLAKGTSQAEVAELTGNTASAISQVASRYQQQIAEKTADATLAGGSHSQKLDTLESLITSKLTGMIALETDTMKVAKMFQLVNSALRRDAGERAGSAGGNTQQTVVQLNLPQQSMKEITVMTNSRNDVVAVDGRDLTPASITSVNSMAGLVHKESENEITRAQAFDDIMAVSIPGLDKC